MLDASPIFFMAIVSLTSGMSLAVYQLFSVSRAQEADARSTLVELGPRQRG